MAKDRTDTGESRGTDRGGDSDWLFARADPRTLPTDRLPSREEFERYAAPLMARDTEPARPPGDPEGRGRAGDTGPIAQIRPSAPASYARSGRTPNAADDEAAGARTLLALPPRFAALGLFDAVRDVVALVCLVSSLTTVFTLGSFRLLETGGRAAVGLALAVLILVHLLRWIPKLPRLRLIRVIRVAGLAPALLVALGALVADLVLSLPVLFAPLPDGPPVGIGAGVSLLLVGVIVGIEPRAHEGYLPAETARSRARTVILGIGIAAAACFVLNLVMLAGRVITTGWAFSLRELADSLVSALLLSIVIGSALRRERSWFVFSAAAVSGLVIGAIADNTLRLSFAGPQSVATGFVYLPFLFAAYAVMISRSFVRTMPLSFRRVDWIVYAVRAFEFSIIMHIATAGWNVLAAIAAAGGIGPGGPVLHLMDAVIASCFVALSLFARRALLERPADQARASAVVAAVVLVVVGFLDVIVNSLASGAGAGLATGGVALAIGIAAALMLTVPAPVRDEFGAPDLARMFEDFRLRDSGRTTLLARVPDIAAERARKKTFPASPASPGSHPTSR
ncbi:DUF7937 domain-containing protein [Brachybacterium hainanense]|uniref:DUF7937 domain-containing protein n=1 Tax=Brachybacterium hainanense TaxID=1541174 RepID=A0ABV6RHA0_9MICO